MSPYRQLERFDCACPRTVDVHVLPYGAWRWGPFAVGFVRWGGQLHRVWSTPWFSFWFKAEES